MNEPTPKTNDRAGANNAALSVESKLSTLEQPKTAQDAEVLLPGTRRTVWEAFVVSGHTPEDVLRPDYWATVPDLMAGDRIEIEPHDLAWVMTIRVMEVDRDGGRVVVHQLGEPVYFKRGKVPSPYEIRYVERVGWQVLNAAKENMINGMATHQGALQWLKTRIGDNSDAYAGDRKGPN